MFVHGFKSKTSTRTRSILLNLRDYIGSRKFETNTIGFEKNHLWKLEEDFLNLVISFGFNIVNSLYD